MPSGRWKGLEHPPEHSETVVVSDHFLWKASLLYSFPVQGVLSAQFSEPDAEKWKTATLFKKAHVWLESAVSWVPHQHPS